MGNVSDLYGGQPFDPNSVDPKDSFDPIPAGWYAVEVEKAEVKETKSGDGRYINMQLSVIGENYNGRKIFDRIMLLHPNPTAVEIGQREMAALGQACGIGLISDTDQLIGCMAEARVKVKTQDGFEPENEVQTYRAMGNPTTPAPQPAPPAVPTGPQNPATPPTPPAPQAAQTQTKLPWER